MESLSEKQCRKINDVLCMQLHMLREAWQRHAPKLAPQALSI